jgi:hypothetical protein
VSPGWTLKTCDNSLEKGWEGLLLAVEPLVGEKQQALVWKSRVVEIHLATEEQPQVQQLPMLVRSLMQQQLMLKQPPKWQLALVEARVLVPMAAQYIHQCPQPAALVDVVTKRAN